ncbi:Kinesin-like protein KIF21A [Smittium culicis]|uniref:Kinesin-like protein KIF21A n=1 Tax=Smittium culicis TaxID=133412 RepID=A0A1R1Y3R0_9FUNG|nr:Kinesin-like protein KIF21A [Smittium culicis]
MALSNVKVALRVKPLSKTEIDRGEKSCITIIPGTNQISIGSDRSFTFDYVFSDSNSQADIYNDCVKPLVFQFLNGYNSTIMAYGQTGSGKTYTMGTADSSNKDEIGAIPRAFTDIFEYLTNKQKKDSNFIYQIEASFVELYNDEIYDLLKPKGKENKISSKKPKGNIGTFKRKSGANNSSQSSIFKSGKSQPENFIWSSIEKVVSKDSAELFEFLSIGNGNRTVGSTDMNLRSSRSHAIFTVTLTQQSINHLAANDSAVLATNYSSNKITSKIHFVDLAGSERIKQTNSLGSRMREGISINSGLLALGNVISALGDALKKQLHIPYRNSKLTRLLEDSLGGNSITLMLACVTETNKNFNESLSTLRYANRSRNIKNKVVISVESNPASEIVALKSQIKDLQTKLKEQSTSLNKYSLTDPNINPKSIEASSKTPLSVETSNTQKPSLNKVLPIPKSPTIISLTNDQTSNPVSNNLTDVGSTTLDFEVVALKKKIAFQSNEIKRLDHLLKIKKTFKNLSQSDEKESISLNENNDKSHKSNKPKHDSHSLNLESAVSYPNILKFDAASYSNKSAENMNASKKSFSIFSKSNKDIKRSPEAGRKSISSFFSSIGFALSNRKKTKSSSFIYNKNLGNKAFRSNGILSHPIETDKSDLPLAPIVPPTLPDKAKSLNNNDWEFVLDVVSKQREDCILFTDDLLEKFKSQSKQLSELEATLNSKIDNAIGNLPSKKSINKDVPNSYVSGSAVGSTLEADSSENSDAVNESNAMIFKALIYSNINQCVDASKLLNSLDSLMKRQDDLVESQNSLFTLLSELEDSERKMYESKDGNNLQEIEKIEVKIYSVQNKVVLIDSELSYLDLRIKDIELQLAELTGSSKSSYLKSLSPDGPSTKLTNIDSADKINFEDFDKLVSQLRRCDLNYLAYLLTQAIVDHRIAETGIVQDREKLREKVFSLQCELKVMRKVAINVASIYEKELFDTESVFGSTYNFSGRESFIPISNFDSYKYSGATSVNLITNSAYRNSGSLNGSIRGPLHSSSYSDLASASKINMNRNSLFKMSSFSGSTHSQNGLNMLKESNFGIPNSANNNSIKPINTSTKNLLANGLDLADGDLFHKISSSNNPSINEENKSAYKQSKLSSLSSNINNPTTTSKSNELSLDENSSLIITKTPTIPGLSSNKGSSIKSPTPLLINYKSSNVKRQSSVISIKDVMKVSDISSPVVSLLKAHDNTNSSITSSNLKPYPDGADPNIFGTISSKISLKESNRGSYKTKIERFFGESVPARNEYNKNLESRSIPRSLRSSKSSSIEYPSDLASYQKTRYSSDAKNPEIPRNFTILQTRSMLDIKRNQPNDLSQSNKTLFRSSNAGKPSINRYNSILGAPSNIINSKTQQSLNASSLTGRKYTIDGDFSFLQSNRASNISEYANNSSSTSISQSEIISRVAQRGVFLSAISNVSQVTPDKPSIRGSSSRWSLNSYNSIVSKKSSINKSTLETPKNGGLDMARLSLMNRIVNKKTSSDNINADPSHIDSLLSKNRKHSAFSADDDFELKNRLSTSSFNSQTFSYTPNSFLRPPLKPDAFVRPVNSFDKPTRAGLNNSLLKQPSLLSRDVNKTFNKNTRQLIKYSSIENISNPNRISSLYYQKNLDSKMRTSIQETFSRDLNSSNAMYNLTKNSISNMSIAQKSMHDLKNDPTDQSLDSYYEKLKSYSKINRESRQLLAKVYQKLGKRKSQDAGNSMLMLEALETESPSQNNKKNPVSEKEGYDSGVELGFDKFQDKKIPSNPQISNNIHDFDENSKDYELALTDTRENLDVTSIKSPSNKSSTESTKHESVDTRVNSSNSTKKTSFESYENILESDSNSYDIIKSPTLYNSLTNNNKSLLAKEKGRVNSNNPTLYTSDNSIYLNGSPKKLSSINTLALHEFKDNNEKSDASCSTTEVSPEKTLPLLTPKENLESSLNRAPESFKSRAIKDLVVQEKRLQNFSIESIASVEGESVKIMNFFPYPPPNEVLVCDVENDGLVVNKRKTINFSLNPSFSSPTNVYNNDDNSEKQESSVIFISQKDKDSDNNYLTNNYQIAANPASEDHLESLVTLKNSAKIETENNNVELSNTIDPAINNANYDTESLSGMSEFSINDDDDDDNDEKYSPIIDKNGITRYRSCLESNDYIKGSGLMSKIL